MQPEIVYKGQIRIFVDLAYFHRSNLRQSKSDHRQMYFPAGSAPSDELLRGILFTSNESGNTYLWIQ